MWAAESKRAVIVTLVAKAGASSPWTLSLGGCESGRDRNNIDVTEKESRGQGQELQVTAVGTGEHSGWERGGSCVPSKAGSEAPGLGTCLPGGKELSPGAPGVRRGGWAGWDGRGRRLGHAAGMTSSFLAGCQPTGLDGDGTMAGHGPLYPQVQRRGIVLRGARHLCAFT